MIRALVPPKVVFKLTPKFWVEFSLVCRLVLNMAHHRVIKIEFWKIFWLVFCVHNFEIGTQPCPNHFPKVKLVMKIPGEISFCLEAWKCKNDGSLQALPERQNQHFWSNSFSVFQHFLCFALSKAICMLFPQTLAVQNETKNQSKDFVENVVEISTGARKRGKNRNLQNDTCNTSLLAPPVAQ